MEEILKIQIMKLKLNLIIAMIMGSTFLITSCNDDTKTTTKNTTESTKIMSDTVNSRTNTPMDTSTRSHMGNSSAKTDQNIINYAVQKNTKEIIWLKAAIEKGVNKDLRAHAKMMLTDHENLAIKVKEIIAKKNYSVPAFDTANEVNINDKMGADWDKAWNGKMVSDHMELINMLGKAEKDVSDPELKNLITKTIPVVQSHLDMAQKLDKKLK